MGFRCGFILAILLMSCPFFGMDAFASVIGLPRPYPELDKKDSPKKFEILIAERTRKYSIPFSGLVDGLRTRVPQGSAPTLASWQPNRFIRIQNVGNNVVQNPRVYANGKGPWKSISHMLDVALGGTQTEAEKARAIYEFVRRQRFHATTWDRQVRDPVKCFNVYGYTLCGDTADILETLWHRAGIRTRRVYVLAHTVSEAFYENAYHQFDADTNTIYLERDNKTIASRESLSRDHDLIRRTHSSSISLKESPWMNAFMAARFTETPVLPDRDIFTVPSEYNVKLRPMESIEWRWDHIGKHYTADLKQDLNSWGKAVYEAFCNGKLRYYPNISEPSFPAGLESQKNIRQTPEGITPLQSAVQAQMVWKIASSYVLVGSRIPLQWEKSKNDQFFVDFSRNGKDWKRIFTATDERQTNTELEIDPLLSLPFAADFRFYIRVTMQAQKSPESVRLKQIGFETDFQHSCEAIPELRSGRNDIVYQDDNSDARRVLVHHSWIERADWKLPERPHVQFPRNGSAVNGTKVRFSWKNPGSSETLMRDHHIQLSDQKDMRWVLSSNFDRLISLTSFQGQTNWDVPSTGLLNPGETYYWRVRSMDSTGVWTDWSDIHSFRCNAPGMPLNPRVLLQKAKSGRYIFLLSELLGMKMEWEPPRVELSWEPNPNGAPSVKYRLYASNERGFTIGNHDPEEKRKLNKIPHSVSVDLTSTKISVVGNGVKHPVANYAFYRVAALDEKGNESAHSPLMEVPRPLIFSTPPSRVKKGSPFQYQIRAIRSLGNLECKFRCLDTFWKREGVTHKISEAPSWLQMDSETGMLRGTPKSTGTFKTVVYAENDNGSRDTQSFYFSVVE